MLALALPLRPRPGERALTAAVLGVIAVAWVALAAMSVPGSLPAGWSGVGVPTLECMLAMTMPVGAAHAASTGLGGGGPQALAMWTLMVLAMMVPSALPAAHHLAVNSLRWRRRRAVATFLAVYVAIWVAVGIPCIAAAALTRGLGRTPAALAALLLAAGWQLTAGKRRALRDCHRTTPLPPTGRRASAGVVRFAAVHTTACVRSCWALMAAMGLAASLTLAWMGGLTALILVEKLSLRPRRATRGAALVLAAGAVAVGVGGLA